MPGRTHRAVFGAVAGVIGTCVPGAPGQVQGIAGPVSIPYNHFAGVCASVPDATGDGRPDILVGALGPGQTAPRARLFMYSGASGAYVRQILLPAVFTDSLPRVAGVPDINGDGRGDIAVAVPFFMGPGGSTGRVFLYSGATGAWIRTLVPPPDTGPRLFAHTIAGIGDINGDGRGEVVVTAIKEYGALPGPDASLVFVMSGASGAVIRKMVVGPPYRWSAGSLLSVAAIPDVNSDGRQDLLVGSAGKILMLSGGTGALLRQLHSGTVEDIGFGWSLGSTPDANGDGVPDLLVGAPFKSGAYCAACFSSYSSGRAYLFSGATGFLLRQWNGPTNHSHYFGWSVTGVADMNGDGRGDVAVGAPSNGAEQPGPGSVYVFSGATGLQIKLSQSPNTIDGGEFGHHVVGLPDTNGNGRGEVFVSAPQEPAPPGMSSNPALYWGRGYFIRY